MRLRLLILLLATLFQTHQLVQDIRFYPDEAFFMTFARHAAVNGDWMLAGSLDKPPLSIYMSALSMVLMGNTTDADGVLHLDPTIGEFAGRLPNVFLAVLLVAVMMRLAHDLYHDERVTLLTGLLTATSPYLLMFGATAFTDMSLLFWLVLAIGLTVRGQWLWAGFALGLAFWSKQQAIFYVPLIVVVGLHVSYKEETCLSGIKIGDFWGFRMGRISSLRKIYSMFVGTTACLVRAGQWGTGILLLLILLLLWDASRPGTSIFLLGTINNAPDTLFAEPSMIFTRLYEWLNLSTWLIGQGWLTLIAVIIAVIGWLQHLIKRDPSRGWDTLFWLFIVAYIGLHTVLMFNQYDRYLLLILPPLILLCARGLSAFFNMEISNRWTGRIPFLHKYDVGITFWLSALIPIILLISALSILYFGIPIGGDKGDYYGIDDLADYLNNKPIATVIYDRWLGWELDYYMGQWTNKRRVYFPTPQTLVEGALALDEIGDRYLVAPLDQSLTTWLSVLESAGFTVSVDYQTEQFIVYRLSVPAWDA